MFLLVMTALAAPSEPHWFEYAFTHRLQSPPGALKPRFENTWGDGRYTLLPGEVTEVQATASWKTSKDGKDGEPGSRDITTKVSAQRGYLGPADVPHAEYQAGDGTVATWLWIPTGLAVGDPVPILNDSCTVTLTAADAGPRAVGVPPGTIEVLCEGDVQRDDDHGKWAGRREDRWYFDPTTGFVLAGRGTISAGSFVLSEQMNVLRASYGEGLWPTFDPKFPVVPEPSGSLWGLWPCCTPVLFVLGVVGLFGYLTTFKGGPSPWVRSRRYGNVWIAQREAGRRGGPVVISAQEARELSEVLGVFVPTLIAQARARSPFPVVAAARAKGKLVGLAITDPEGKFGTVLGRCPQVTDALRRWTGQGAMLTDTPPEGAPWRPDEPCKVMRLTLPLLEAPNYDRQGVRRATPADAEAISAITDRVFKTPCPIWARTTLESEDLGFVALIGKRVVGFVFVSAVGDEARVHSLTVDGEHQGVGVGRELLRAALSTAVILGARTVLALVPASALGAAHLAKQAGFEPGSDLWVTGHGAAAHTATRRWL